MIVQCPGCGKRYRLDDAKGSTPGLQVRCSGCETEFSPVPDRNAPPPPSPGEGQGEGGKRVLVCDDAPFFRAMIQDILSEAGFAVETASNGEEALAAIDASPPDMLVLDLQMPGMGGFDVIREVRRRQQVSKLPILAVSAVYTDSADMIELQDAGADDYIGKKFKPEHLLRRVRRLLDLPAAGE